MSYMKKQEKTNVMRILDQRKINYNSYDYTETNAVSGMEVATSLNEDPNKVFKTLVTVAKSKINYVFVVPVNKELDLKKERMKIENNYEKRFSSKPTKIY